MSRSTSPTAHADTDLLFDLYGHPEQQVATDAVRQAFAIPGARRDERTLEDPIDAAFVRAPVKASTDTAYDTRRL